MSERNEIAAAAMAHDDDNGDDDVTIDHLLTSYIHAYIMSQHGKASLCERQHLRLVEP